MRNFVFVYVSDVYLPKLRIRLGFGIKFGPIIIDIIFEVDNDTFFFFFFSSSSKCSNDGFSKVISNPPPPISKFSIVAKVDLLLS